MFCVQNGRTYHEEIIAGSMNANELLGDESGRFFPDPHEQPMIVFVENMEAGNGRSGLKGGNETVGKDLDPIAQSHFANCIGRDVQAVTRDRIMMGR